MAWLIVLLSWMAAGGALARSPADLCRSAAGQAAKRYDVPEKVMRAITLVETRRTHDGQTGPWPWTVNVAGRGAWFDTRSEALTHAWASLQAGQKSFDVGCFQLNYRWHGRHFSSLEAMFDPQTSGEYAARFLRQLYDETGDWLTAAGYYHSRTPQYATRYRRLVSRALDGELPSVHTDTPPTELAKAAPLHKPGRAASIAWNDDAPDAVAGGVRLRMFHKGGALPSRLGAGSLLGG